MRYLWRYLVRREAAYVLITITALLWGATCETHGQIRNEIAPYVPHIHVGPGATR